MKVMRVKEESEKVGLKLNIQKTKIMASGPITSWDGETVETVSEFIFLGSKITSDGDCSHEIIYYGRRDHLSASLFLILVLPIGLLEQLDWMLSFSAGVYVLR